MSCAPLAGTGLPVLAVLALAGLFLAAGVALMLVSRSGRGRTATVALVLLVIGGSVYLGGAITAHAHAATGCPAGSGAGAGGATRNGTDGPAPTGANGASATGASSSPGTGSGSATSPGDPSSTSPGDGSPTGSGTGAAHLAIVQTSTMIGLAPGIDPTAITGRITNDGTGGTYVVDVTVSITGVTGSGTGTCDASDYLLLDTVMPVGRTLAPGASADFAGARIGFRNKSVNQDACQRAVIDLSYVSS